MHTYKEKEERKTLILRYKGCLELLNLNMNTKQ